MNGENICLFDYSFECCHFNAQFAAAFGRNVWVVGNETHVESACALGNQRADAAEAQDAERFAGKLDAFPLAALPAPRGECAMSLRHVAGNGQDQRHGVFGGGKHVGLRCIHHHHALFGGRFNVDVVQPDARASNDYQLFACCQHCCVNHGGRTNDEGVRAVQNCV